MNPKSLMLPMLLGSLFSSHAEEPQKNYNVLFIAVDDLRPELGCYGNPNIKTPNLDALAGKGLLFERAYCQVALCNPSRSSLLSGLRPDTTGIYDNNKYVRTQKPDVVTLPQYFKDNGWYSISMGKIYHHSASQPGNDPLSWSEPMLGHGTPYRHWFTPESNALVKAAREAGKRIARGPAWEVSDTPDDDYPDGKTALKAIEQMRRLKDQRFFMAVGFIKPHLPFTCPKKYWDLYPKESINLPDNMHPPEGMPAPALSGYFEMGSYSGGSPGEKVPDDEARNLIHAYKACVSFVDAQIGRVISELERLGLREKTIIVVWGDHGWHLGEHGHWGKTTNFEVATRSPLIISVPGQKNPGAKTKALVEFVDIYPSLAELCGLPAPSGVEGTSFAPLLDNPNRSWKTAAFSQYGRPRAGGRYSAERDDPMGYSMRTNRYRYTEWIKPDKTNVGIELYDLEKDPKSNVNIANRPKNKKLMAELSKKLHAGWKAARPSTNNPGDLQPTTAKTTPNPVVRFTPISPAQVEIGGEIGRRIDITLYNNIMKLDMDGEFLEPFRQKNWPDPDGKYGRLNYLGFGKTLDALSNLAVHKKNDPLVKKFAANIFDKLLNTQSADGYLGTFNEQSRFAASRLRVKWDLHELSYLLFALVTNYRNFDHEPSLVGARRLADYIMEKRPQKSPWHFEQLGLERAFIALADATGEKKYRDYGSRGTLNLWTWNAPPDGEHAYWFISTCLAQIDLYRNEPTPTLLTQSGKVIDFLTKNNGLLVNGSCTIRERFHTTQDVRLSPCENCAHSYLLRLLHHLRQIDGASLYGDIMERTIYNALFSGQSEDGQRLHYFCQVEEPRRYFGVDGYCCPGNFRRAIAELPEMIYYAAGDDLLINLYAASQTNFAPADVPVKIRQETDYPNTGEITIHIDPLTPIEFSISLRIPRWCETPTVFVNKKPIAGACAGADLKIKRRWNVGDRIQCSFPMNVRFVKGREMQSRRAVIMRGPVVYGLNPARQPAPGKFKNVPGENEDALHRLLLQLAEVRLKIAARKNERAPIANLITGGSAFAINPLTGYISADYAGALPRSKYSVNTPVPVSDSPFVDCVLVPDGGEGSVTLTTTGITGEGVPDTDGGTLDYIRPHPVVNQAWHDANGINYTHPPHSMIAMHANKALTLDMDYIRRCTGHDEFTFRTLACSGAFRPPSPVAEFAVYIDGQCIVFPTILKHKTPVPVEISLKKNQRFLTLFAISQGSPVFAQLFFADPMIEFSGFADDKSPVGDLINEEKRLLAQIDALGSERTAPRLIKEMIIDAKSVSLPVPDSNIRTGGLKLLANAWSNHRLKPGQPDLKIELTEFADPGIEAIYFQTHGDGSDDELIAAH